MEYKAAAGSGDPVLSHRVFSAGRELAALPCGVCHAVLEKSTKTKNARILTNQGANLEGRDIKDPDDTVCTEHRDFINMG